MHFCVKKIFSKLYKVFRKKYLESQKNTKFYCKFDLRGQFEKQHFRVELIFPKASNLLI